MHQEGRRCEARIHTSRAVVVAPTLDRAQARNAEIDQAERPLGITKKLVLQTIDDMNGILDHAPLATRVAWVRDLFERIDVDSRDEKAVAVWGRARRGC